MLPTKPAPTKQMLFTGGGVGKAVIVAERVCRFPPSPLRSGDSPRELGGDVAGVASSDAQFSDAEQIEVVNDTVLMSRTSAGRSISVGRPAIMQVKRRSQTSGRGRRINEKRKLCVSTSDRSGSLNIKRTYSAQSVKTAGSYVYCREAALMARHVRVPSVCLGPTLDSPDAGLRSVHSAPLTSHVVQILVMRLELIF